MPTKVAFVDQYRQMLLSAHAWAADEAKLTRFLASCSDTIEGRATSWDHNGEAARAAYRAIGGTGTMTLKALRALPAQ